MKKFLVTTLILAVVLGAGPLAAQEERVLPQPCPHPVATVLHGTSSTPSPDPADFHPPVAGSQWNQTAYDKPFQHTFHFAKQCCLMTSGTLVIKLKALKAGTPGTSTSANDKVYLVSNGVTIQTQSPFAAGATLGQTATVTFTIPANVLATGRVSFGVQDDSAVTAADLTLHGCCI